MWLFVEFVQRRPFHKFRTLFQSYIMRHSLQLQFVRRDPIYCILSKKSLQYIIAIFISWIRFHLLFAINQLVGKDFAIWKWGLIKEGKPVLRISQKKRISLITEKIREKSYPPPLQQPRRQVETFFEQEKDSLPTHCDRQRYSQTILIIWLLATLRRCELSL